MLEARTPDAGIGAPPDAGRGGSRYRDQRIAQCRKRGLPMPDTAHRPMLEEWPSAICANLGSLPGPF